MIGGEAACRKRIPDVQVKTTERIAIDQQQKKVTKKKKCRSHPDKYPLQ
jgi:hypothetical protein